MDFNKNLERGNVSAITVILMNHSSSKCNKPRNYHINILCTFHIYHIRLSFPLQYVPKEIILVLKLVALCYSIMITISKTHNHYSRNLNSILFKSTLDNKIKFIFAQSSRHKNLLEFYGHSVNELIIMRIEGTYFIFHSNRPNL